ncbi:MAG: S8 family serine peptidase [Terasakiella sp.]|uniref:S8 family serine peptidase n=1 Tax=unclassified Terasakiella TaxID=2614952 RepID=UPI003B005E62
MTANNNKENADRAYLESHLISDSETASIWQPEPSENSSIQQEENSSLDISPNYLPTGGEFSKQWHLKNTGQTGGLVGIDINVEKVWDDYTGAGTTVAVVDDGIDYTHEDLNDNYLLYKDYDYADYDLSAMAEAGDYHGTPVAGLIAAENNGIGGVGVAYDSKIAGLRLNFSEIYTTDLVNILFRSKSFDVVNNSWGFVSFFSDPGYSIKTALQNTVDQGRNGLGTSIVYSAGNEKEYSFDVNYKFAQNSRFTIAVGAITQDGQASYYSTPGAAVLVSAPSNGHVTGIYTTDRSGAEGYSNTNYTNEFGGTSASAPIVSGVIALLYEANPLLGYRDIQQILAYSARQVDQTNPEWNINGAGNWNGGGMHFSHEVGFGLVDAHAAIRMAETWTFQSTFANEESVTSTHASGQITANQTNSFVLSVNQHLDIQNVAISLDLTGQAYFLRDMVISLTSPDGTKSILSTSAYTTQTELLWDFTSVQHWGEDSYGDWTLTFEDTSINNSTLVDANITFYGNTGADDIYVYTEEFNQIYSAGRSSIQDTNGGTDTLNAAAITSNLTINLNAGTTSTIDEQSVQIATGTIIENAFGGDGNDTLIGNDQSNTLSGGRGNDTISGGQGVDYLYGNVGDDTLSGGDGDDYLYGGTGDDVAYFAGNYLNYHISDGANSSVLISNDTWTDTLFDIEWLKFDNALYTIPEFKIASNRAPIAETVSLSTGENTTLTGTLSASDPDDDTLSFSLVSAPSKGNMVINSNGTYQFTPGLLFDALGKGESENIEFTYSVSDGIATTTQTATITVNGENDAPNVQNQTTEATEGNVISGTLLATDPDQGATLTYRLISGPDKGQLTLNSNGTYSFDPVGEFKSLSESASETVSFTFQVTDEHSATTTATMTVNVSGINDAPVLSKNPTISLSDHDNTTLISATLTLSDAGAQDYLFVSIPDNVSVTQTYNPKTGILTLSGEADHATYEDLLNSLQVISTSVTSRTVTLQVADPANQNYTSNTITHVLDSVTYDEVWTNNSDTFAGTSGIDKFFGADGHDTLTGGGGDDILIGGAGYDTAIFSGNKSDYAITKGDTGFTVSHNAGNGSDGIDTLHLMERLQFADGYHYLQKSHMSFDGDFTSDIIWRHTNGRTVLWDLNREGALDKQAEIGTFTRDWTMLGDGDFNGDGISDILWRTQEGKVVIWGMNNGSYSQNISLGVISTDWSIVGHGDYTGDGTSDIFWRGGNGETVIWALDNGATNISRYNFGTISTDWNIIGDGDYNGDGTADILWRNSSGQVVVWGVTQGVMSSSHTLGTLDSSWYMSGDGDYNGDGTADILWRKTDGQTLIWELDDGDKSAEHSLGTIDADLKLVGEGDYTGDGTSDLLWLNGSGYATVWEMNNGTHAQDIELGRIGTGWSAIGDKTPQSTTRLPTTNYSEDSASDIMWRDSNGHIVIWNIDLGIKTSTMDMGTISMDWAIAGNGDYTGDGTADILWRAENGNTVIWGMDGGSYSKNIQLGTVDTTWSIAGRGDYTGDGVDDIFWRGINGEAIIWAMDGGNGKSATYDFGMIGTDWKVIGDGDYNGDGTADILWRNRSGQTVVWGINNGAMFTSHNLGTHDTDWNMIGSGDYNGDGTSDILWRDEDGQTLIWEMNNGEKADEHSMGTISTSWNIVGDGDYTGDGTSDILWLNQVGDVAVWEMENGAYSQQINFERIGENWSAMGDKNISVTPRPASVNFSSDSSSDIVWRNTEGHIVIWNMDQGTQTGTIDLGAVSTDWSIVGNGDYTGDGTSDILWRHNNGNTVVWGMDGGSYSQNIQLGIVDTAWSVVGRGDYTGDGTSDIFWRGRNGEAVIWAMDGGNGKSATYDFGMIGTDWKIIGDGDYTGDGTSDILWRDSNGQTVVWGITNGVMTSSHNLGTHDLSWNMINSGDYNGDGTSDVLWRNDDGRTLIWEMEYGNKVEEHSLGTINTSWHIVGDGDYTGDGTSDILWLNDAGDAAIWEMDDAAYSRQINLENRGTEWTTIDNNCVINGSNSDDVLNGDEKPNVIIGNDGNDTISGGLGKDILSGGAGEDIFVLEAGLDTFDIIEDFISGTDQLHIALSGLENTFGLNDGPLRDFALEIQGNDSKLSNAYDWGWPSFYLSTSEENHTALYFDGDGVETAYQSTKIAEFSNNAIITAEDIKLI